MDNRLRGGVFACTPEETVDSRDSANVGARSHDIG